MSGRTMSLDDFMNHNPRSGGGGGGFLKSWKKDGQLLGWLHTIAYPVPFYNHPIPRVREVEEDGEKVLKIWGDRWGCHEPEEVVKKQYFRDKKTGKRDVPPTVCPVDMLIEWVYGEVQAGRLDWLEPVFRWEAGSDKLIVTAGGMYNAFRSKDITREQKAQMRRAGIRADEAWNQNFQARLQYLIHLVDDAHPDNGVQKTFEGAALGNKLRKAIADEMKRQGRERGNPSLNPYPFQFEYDDSKDFDERYDVIAMSNKQPSEEVRKLITSELKEPDRDVQPGDCWSLRANLEEHAVLKDIPWDRIFAAAEKKGLMKPPEESKADREATDFDPEKIEQEERQEQRAAAAATSKHLHEVVVGEDHPTWQDETWKPEASMRGTRVVLVVPEDIADEVVKEVTEMFEKAGAVVTERVACEHCGKPMTTHDDACPHCGAKYSAEGALLTRPCLKEGCGAQVEVGKDDEPGICGKCATIHEMHSGKWRMKPTAEAAPEPVQPTRRVRGRGVPFDQRG